MNTSIFKGDFCLKNSGRLIREWMLIGGHDCTMIVGHQRDVIVCHDCPQMSHDHGSIEPRSRGNRAAIAWKSSATNCSRPIWSRLIGRSRSHTEAKPQSISRVPRPSHDLPVRWRSDAHDASTRPRRASRTISSWPSKFTYAINGCKFRTYLDWWSGGIRSMWSMNLSSSRSHPAPLTTPRILHFKSARDIVPHGEKWQDLCV